MTDPIDRALKEAHDAMGYLMQQGTPLVLAHDSFVRTMWELLDTIRRERAQDAEGIFP